MKAKATLVVGLLIVGFFVARPIVRQLRVNRLVAELPTATVDRRDELVLQLAGGSGRSLAAG